MMMQRQRNGWSWLTATIVAVQLLAAASALSTGDSNNANAHANTNVNTNVNANVNANVNSNHSILDIPKLRERIYSGRVYQHESFLTEAQVRSLLQEVSDLERGGSFERKGLSDTSMKNQSFTNTDRTVCVVPWFIKALEGRDDGEVPTLIRNLQLTLQKALNRPTIGDVSLSHECYYSKSEVGASLPRHMDERHEELKGAKGWLLPSRRSLSWLIYLSDEDWQLETNGGALRSFPQRSLSKSVDSTHDGNLLVGWLLAETDHQSHPVYLDSWHPVIGIVAEGTIQEPHCILYAVDDRNGDGQEERRYITRPWLNDGLQGVSPADFILAWSQHDAKSVAEHINTNSGEGGADGAGGNGPTLFLSKELAQRFVLLEDRGGWQQGQQPEGSIVDDIAPKRGSLVVFDSVMLPHQVETIKNGTRTALAGWFHEATQQFPEAFYQQ